MCALYLHVSREFPSSMIQFSLSWSRIYEISTWEFDVRSRKIQLMIYYILIASLFGNVQILLGEFRCRLLSGLAKQTAVSFVKLHWISLLFHTAWDELIKWTFCIMRSAPTVLIKVNMSFAGSEKTHGVGLLFIAQEVFNSLITYDISSFPFSIVIGLLRVELTC